MTGLDWSHPTIEDVLNFGVWVLMVLIMLGLAVWLARYIVENVVKILRWVHRSNYDALLRENERLRDSLAEAREENSYLRKLYRDLPSRAEENKGQNAA